MLDANALSDLIRNPDGKVKRRIETVGVENICTSIVAAGELRFGAAKRRSQMLTTKVEDLLMAIPVINLSIPVDRIYGEVRASLERDGKPIGANDLLIAAHALALGCIVVTDNEREFSRVPGLTIENWVRT
ncbi:MAG: type II toxin-antitoxin system VapC family toxin [Sphingomonadales bacterium]